MTEPTILELILLEQRETREDIKEIQKDIRELCIKIHEQKALQKSFAENLTSCQARNEKKSIMSRFASKNITLWSKIIFIALAIIAATLGITIPSCLL